MSEPRRAHSRFYRVRTRLEAMAVEPGPRGWFLEFLVFGFKQGWACLLGALMLALLPATHVLWTEDAPIPRHYALTMGALLIPLSMFPFRLDTRNQAAVTPLLHIVDQG